MIKFSVITLSDTCTAYTTGIDELSSICFNKDKTKMYGVSDKGYIYQINTNSSPTLLYQEDNLDLEGITVDDKDDIYVVSERKGIHTDATPTSLYKLNNSNETYSIELIKSFDIKPTYSSNTGSDIDKDGFEGIAYYLNNQFYLGFQTNPVILRYSATTGQTLKTFKLNFTSEIADLDFVSLTNSVWIIDSKTGYIHVCNNQFGLILTIDLGKIVKDGTTKYKDLNPESIAVDWDKKEIWIGCEDGIGEQGSLKNLFKISFTVSEVPISSVYFMKHVCNKVMYGLKEIWSNITGCFSSGFWIETADWIDTETWKY